MTNKLIYYFTYKFTLYQRKEQIKFAIILIVAKCISKYVYLYNKHYVIPLNYKQKTLLSIETLFQNRKVNKHLKIRKYNI